MLAKFAVEYLPYSTRSLPHVNINFTTMSKEQTISDPNKGIKEFISIEGRPIPGVDFVPDDLIDTNAMGNELVKEIEEEERAKAAKEGQAQDHAA